MVKVNINNKIIEVESGTRLINLINYSEKPNEIVGGYVNNLIKSLNYPFNEDCKLRFINIHEYSGLKIYERTLIFILAKAAYEEFTDRKLEVKHSLGGGIYCEFKDGKEVSQIEVLRLKNKMADIIKNDYEIYKYKLKKEDAIKELKEHTCVTNLDLLKYVDEEVISIYDIDGCYGYFYGKMLPSTRYINVYDVKKYKNGIVLLGINPKDINSVIDFVAQDKMYAEFQSMEEWGGIMGVNEVSALNEKIETGHAIEVMAASEARHEYLLSKMAEEIAASKVKKRIILIAGPSSAGKTTTSKRLQAHLMVKGLKPITIGLDDYFCNREDTPLGEDGKPDYESINAIDVKLFNKNLTDLIDGKEVSLPSFDFKKGYKEFVKPPIKITEENPIIIEGIHGLNSKLTESISRAQKYIIFINTITQINLDQYNRVPTSDIRLIRRIVRDTWNRGTPPIKTIDMWQSVRRGEQINIYPYQEEADFVFNTALLYELPVLRKYALPVLKEISENEDNYYEVKRLIDFLECFLPIEDETPIYTNSLLREFIGGGIYI